MWIDFSTLPGPRLTQKVHQALSTIIQPNDVVIDATVGNGHDTIFLAKKVLPHGIVFGFDIQSIAIQNTRQRCIDLQLQSNTHLFQESHAQLLSIIPEPYHQKISIIMFNLGYLPSGDKSITTLASNTVIALNAALKILKPFGTLSILIYPGHPSGLIERNIILDWLSTSIAPYPLLYQFHHEALTNLHSTLPLPPEWLCIQKLNNQTN